MTDLGLTQPSNPDETVGVLVRDGRDLLRVPAARSDSLLTFDITDLNKAERRCDEVASVTRVKAPELLSLFSKANAAASRLVVALTKEHSDAIIQLDRIKAEVLLDRAPQKLREKGLITTKSPAGSEELRQAVVNSDPQYVACLEKVSILDAMKRLIAIKAKLFDNSFTAIKKIMGEDAFGYGGLNGSAGNEGDADVGSRAPDDGFGRPRYR